MQGPSMHESQGEGAAFFHILLPDSELDASIAESGAKPSAHLPIEAMRHVVGDVLLAVSCALATASDGEFLRSIRALKPLANPLARSFGGQYMQYLLGQISAMPLSHCIEPGDVSGRFDLIRARLLGNE